LQELFKETGSASDVPSLAFGLPYLDHSGQVLEQICTFHQHFSPYISNPKIVMPG